MDRDLVRGPRAAIGQFRCPVTCPAFRDTGPIREYIVVFPRTGVQIRHEGSRPFLADPTVATIYNRAQRYERFAASPEGDRCDWFAVSDEVAREIVGAFDARAAESDRPFRHAWAPTPAALYLRQRALVRRAEAGQLDACEAEEEAIAIVGEVLAVAHRASPRPASGARAAARRRELTEAARAEIYRTVTRNTPVHELAATLGTSPFHLCRVFRACTGRTMHGYRSELRVRQAVELLQSGGATGLSAMAHGLGFASHSHFVLAMRRHIGATPTHLRRMLTTATAAGGGD